MALTHETRVRFPASQTSFLLRQTATLKFGTVWRFWQYNSAWKLYFEFWDSFTFTFICFQSDTTTINHNCISVFKQVLEVEIFKSVLARDTWRYSKTLSRDTRLVRLLEYRARLWRFDAPEFIYYRTYHIYYRREHVLVNACSLIYFWRPSIRQVILGKVNNELCWILESLH